MSTTETLMVASTLDEVTVGQEFQTLPPHLTVFPWFELDTDRMTVFDDDMREVLEQTRSPVITGGSVKQFGIDEATKVRRLDRPTERFNLISDFWVHALVYRSVSELGRGYDPRYVGLHYAPHISDSATRSVAENEIISLNNLTVFKKDEQRRKLVKAVYLWDKIDG